MRGQVVRGSQADNPGDMPLQLRRLAERQACVFQRLRPREQGFAIVGQAIAALMAAKSGTFSDCSSRSSLRDTVAIPMFILSAAPLSVPARAMARNMRASSQLNSAVISFPFMENGSPFSALFIIFAGMILHATRGDKQAIRSPVLSSPERPCTMRDFPLLRIRLT